MVQRYLDLLMREKQYGERTQNARMQLISQEYIESRGIDPDIYVLNDPAHASEFRIVGAKNHYVTVKAIDRGRGRYFLFTLRLIKENGELRIEPSGSVSKKEFGSVGNYIHIIWHASEWIE